MKGLWKRIFGNIEADTDAKADSSLLAASTEAGQIYSFQTRPFTEFSPPVTGRFSAIKILGVSQGYVVVAVLDGIWSKPPTFSDVRSTSIICEHRFAHTGRPAVFGAIREWWKPSKDLGGVDKFTHPQAD